MKKFMILVAAAVMSLAPMTASAARVFVGGGFYGGYWGPGFYGPYPYYAYGPAVGQIKFDTKSNDEQVFINGAFAGTTKDAHTLHLRPGSYNIEVRHAGQEAFAQQVFVIAGKTVHLHPDAVTPTP